MEPLTFKTVFTTLFGGVLGAYVVYCSNKRHHRVDCTLKIFDKAEYEIELIEKCFYILKYEYETDDNGAQVVLENEYIRKKNHKYAPKDQFDTIIRIGDFLNRLSFLCLTWKVNVGLIKKTNLINIVNNFVFLLKNSKFHIQQYNVNSVTREDDYVYVPWQEGWKFLYDLSEGKWYLGHKILELFF